MSDIMDKVHRYIAATVALISTTKNYEPNVMAAEWTIQVSYDPMLNTIFIYDSPLYPNIKETQVLRINIASDDQTELITMADGYSLLEKVPIPNNLKIYKSTCIDDLPMGKELLQMPNAR